MRGPAWLTPSTLADHVSLSARVSVHYQGRVIATDLPLVSGTFESSLSRGVMDKVTMVFDRKLRPVSPWDALEKNGQTSHLWVDVTLPNGDLVPIDMGFFQHESWTPKGGSIQVLAYGLLVRADDNPFPWPTSPGKGATVGQELQRLCSPGLTVVENNVTSRVLPAGLAWGNDRIKAIDDLCVTTGIFVRVEADQMLHPYDLRELRTPVVTFSESDLVLDVEGGGGERLPNVFTGKGGDEKDASKRWSHTIQGSGVDDPASYGVKRELVNVQSAKSAGEVRSATEKAYAEAAVVVEQLSLAMLSDPRVEVGDPVAVVLEDYRADGGWSTFGCRVTGHAFDLVSNTASSARMDVDVLRW